MAVYQDIQARQIWADPGLSQPSCEGYRLPIPGQVTLNGMTITLEQDGVFQPICEGAASPSATVAVNESLPVWGHANPFEATVVPQMFVLGAMLVVAWSLVIILMITPRTSFVLGTGVGHLGRPNGNSSTVISIGGRPWLQKFAAFTVGVSLFIAAVNSFKIIEQQYELGYQDALAVTNGVANSLEVRIIRVISTTFVWLAQIQTLIRLFPRHREKVIIKWAGFGLIILDTLFVILNNFVSHDGNGPKTIKPRGYTEVIPVLSYLFELSLNLLYAAWVIYYSFVKRRFAFFHPQMRNIAVVSLLSYVSVLIPVVFFITDIAKSQVAAWGDYIRWVGSAAASVVVWEWVERIEALEREERKNGILGREIFDGDESFGKSPSLKFPKWPRPRKGRNDTSSSNGSGGTGGSANSTDSQRTQTPGGGENLQLSNIQASGTENRENIQDNNRRRRSILHSFRPPAVDSPVPRSDTASAASTVYAVVHHPPSTSTTPAQDPNQTQGISTAAMEEIPPAIEPRPPAEIHVEAPVGQRPTQRSSTFLPAIGNPFKRRRSSPPPEVSRTAVDAAGRPSQARWNNRRSPKNIFRLTRPQIPPADLPIVVVPAQPRGHIWTPPVEDGDQDPMDRTTQDPRTGENMAGHTPLSLDSSIQDRRGISARPANHPTDRGSPISATGRGGEYLTSGNSILNHTSDRAHSPRTVLPRVDEQTEIVGNEDASVGYNNEADPTSTSNETRPAG